MLKLEHSCLNRGCLLKTYFAKLSRNIKHEIRNCLSRVAAEKSNLGSVIASHLFVGVVKNCG